MPPLASRLILTSMLALACARALACSCDFVAARPSGFLHVAEDGSIALPANALGVLFIEPDKIWNKPAPVPPAQGDFKIMDASTGHPVDAVLTKLNIDAQLDKEYGRAPGTNETRGAGLFRVAPLGGFVAGHTYFFGYREFREPLSVRSNATVKVGARLPVSPADRFTIAPQGEPVRQMLGLSAGSMCSRAGAAVVQKLEYALPPTRTAYRHLLVAFTGEQFFGREPGWIGQRRSGFVPVSYSSSSCSQSPAFGTSDVGQGKEMVYARCPTFFGKYNWRQVRGLAGMLELEDKLHQTPVLDVRFSKAAGPYCWVLRLKEE